MLWGVYRAEVRKVVGNSSLNRRREAKVNTIDFENVVNTEQNSNPGEILILEGVQTRRQTLGNASTPGSDEEDTKAHEEEENKRCFKSHFLLIVLKSACDGNLRSAL